MRKEKTKHKLLNAKHSRGITLVALIITIIVLLILAVVSIGAIKNSKIIAHSQNAANKWKEEQGKENELLEDYLGKIESILSDGSSGENDTKIGKATVGTIVSKNSTINGEAYSSSNPVIPAGFKAINVTTSGHESKWDAESGPQVTAGLVISDGNSEFVWIPVEVNSFSPTSSIIEKEPCVITGRDEESYDAVTDNLEIAGVVEKDGKESLDENDFLIQLTEEYNAMVESVNKYKGFYVGRYELSLGSNGNAQCIAGVLPITAEPDAEENWSGSWYGLYALCKTYQKSSVKSSMIWGNQYNAVMTFIGNRARQEGNVSHDLSNIYETGGTAYEGTVQYNDIINNIYDLEGNVHEWTLSGMSNILRALRGGSCTHNGMPMNIAGDLGYPDDTDYDYGSRLTLYIK